MASIFAVSGRESEEEDDVVEAILKKSIRSVSSYRARIAMVICPNFRVQVIVNSVKGELKKSIILVGLSNDVKCCIEVLEFAWRIYEKFSDKALKKRKTNLDWSRSKSNQVKEDYLSGFLVGLQELFKYNNESKAIVILKDKRVEQALEKMGVDKKETCLMDEPLDISLAYQGYCDAKLAKRDSFLGGKDED